jgi:hypothetical protein
MRSWRKASVIAFAVIAGCGGGTGGEDQNTAGGPCVVLYAEPILALTSATDSATGSAISAVELSDVTVAGRQLDLQFGLSGAKNVSVAGESIICRLPCALGTSDGEYRFNVKAAGYRNQAQNILAAYSQFGGGCPASYSGATAVALRLTPL